MQNLKRGFTLIELLVVIAIIGILAAIVLASLGTARTKGKNAAVQEEMASIRNQAEVYYSGSNNYGTGYAAGTGMGAVVDISPTNCTANSANAAGMFSATAANNGLQSLLFAMCSNGATAIKATVNATNATTWALSATLPDGTGGACVDSNGTSKTYATAAAATPAAGGGCP